MINSFETGSGTRIIRAKPMQELKISQDKITQDFIVKPNVIRLCLINKGTREVLNAGMERNTMVHHRQS